MAKNLPRAHRWALQAAHGDGAPVTIPYFLGLLAAQTIVESNSTMPTNPYAPASADSKQYLRGLRYGVLCNSDEALLIARLFEATTA